VNEAVRQEHQNQTTGALVAPTASGSPSFFEEAFHAPPLDGRNGYASLEPAIDPGLSSELWLDSIISDPSDEFFSQAQADEPVRLDFPAQALVASESAVDYRHCQTNSTPDGGRYYETTRFGELGQDVTANARSRTLADVGNPAIIQSNLLHSLQGAGHLDVPELFTQGCEATSFSTNALGALPQADVASFPSALQPDHIPQLVYSCVTCGHTCSGPQHEAPSVYPDGDFAHRDLTGADHSDYAASQNFDGGTHHKDPVAFQNSVLTPPVFCQQYGNDSQMSYGTPQSASDPYFNYRQVTPRPVKRRILIANTYSSQLRLSYTSASANHLTPTDSIAYSHDGSFEGFPPPARPVLSRKRSSDISFTQQSTQLSYGSNEIDLSSPLATTPLQANPTKRRCPSAISRPEAFSTRVLQDLAGLAGAGLVSPTTNAAGVSRQSSSASSARPFGCEEPGCSKRFMTQANLRYVFRESESRASGLLNYALDITRAHMI
jgi:hypothetical protein